MLSNGRRGAQHPRLASSLSVVGDVIVSGLRDVGKASKSVNQAVISQANTLGWPILGLNPNFIVLSNQESGVPDDEQAH